MAEDNCLLLFHFWLKWRLLGALISYWLQILATFWNFNLRLLRATHPCAVVGMKSHWIFLIDNLSIITFWSNLSNSSFNSWFALTNFCLLSLQIWLGLPRLDVNLWSAIIKQSVLTSPANGLFGETSQTSKYSYIPFIYPCIVRFLSPFCYQRSKVICFCVIKWQIKYCRRCSQ